jgi:flavin reductase (DIM6/NTAB) family NADH-FMN oxidoreductase RutF
MTKKTTKPSGALFSLTNHEIYLLSVRDDAPDNAQDNAMIITWVVPATLVPDMPRVLVVLSTENLSTEIIGKTGQFCLQMLAEGQHELLGKFGLRSGREEDKLAGHKIERSPGGLALFAGTCGWAECRVLDEMNGGDRMIYLAEVVAQHVDGSRRPLRKVEAFSKLPLKVSMALGEKRLLDGARDRELIRRDFS